MEEEALVLGFKDAFKGTWSWLVMPLKPEVRRLPQIQSRLGFKSETLSQNPQQHQTTTTKVART